ncbi:circularly permuted type 2 ATP-grasp protein [Azospirillum sp.]|uniref:circularly permuted type 2 ATP-grasp protein n=1 Tax=Azospirillum sp. TaxID=34012 RepID=UPI003D756923
MADTSISSVAQGSLFGEADALGYTTPVVYDEMVDGRGRLRPHWQIFMGSLGGLDPGRMAERWEEARRLLHQNGVTFNIYGDPQGMERPWPLDMLPLVIPPEEWQTIAAGLAQRARLLNAVLADVYGPQTLVRDGALPPALVFADPGFRRAVHGVPVPGGTHLHFYAADLARAADGRWWVMSDRTQAPSGSGYALENRAVLTRVLPDSFRVCRVERLAPFFADFRETLASLAPRGGEGRVVLLTPGPYNETYFEHVYLARHLGITLVEGADLTVRDRRVWLKTLSGLEPVDVILRRLDDDFADPLALRVDSSLGVAGLAEAVRAGTVAVANALGSGLLESLSFRPFLDGLNERLFGEELILPHVATWWCGQEAECAHVLEHLDELVIAPAFRSLPFDPVHGHSLSAAQRDDLAARIRRSPWAFVAHQPPGLSTAPVWEGDHLQPRPLVLRVFLCATPDGGYTAMPGGLTRVCAEPGRLIVSMQHGGGSKDTWVLSSSRRVEPTAHRAVPDARPLRAATGDLPSRVADGLFWLGRYAERAEGCVRLLRGAYGRVTDGNQPGAPEELKVLLHVMAPLGIIPWELTRMATSRGLDSALRAAVFDESHPNSLRANAQRLHRAGYSVRDRLSLDLWRVISQLDRQSQAPARRIDAAALLLRLDDLMTSLAALAGLEQESMMRGHGWRFLDMGRRMERAVHMVSLVRCTRLASPEPPDANTEAASLEVLLELGESFMAYRERTLAGVDRGPVLDLLLPSEENPRALAFQLAALERHVAALPRGSGEASAAAIRLLAAARTALRGSDALHHPEALRTALDALGQTLPDLSNLLAHAYFSHAFARPA